MTRRSTRRFLLVLKFLLPCNDDGFDDDVNVLVVVVIGDDIDDVDMSAGRTNDVGIQGRQLLSFRVFLLLRGRVSGVAGVVLILIIPSFLLPRVILPNPSK